jgi:hypothetical protein
VQNGALGYIIKLLTDDKERAAFQHHRDYAMANAHLSLEEQNSLKNLTLADLTPDRLGGAVLSALKSLKDQTLPNLTPCDLGEAVLNALRGPGPTPGHGPP